MNRKELKKAACAAVDALAAELNEISLFIHNHPELGNEEHQAVTRLTAAIAKHGFTVETGCGNLPTAFQACKGSSGPKIGFLAEYDALPELGHACGHNLIAAMSYGAAVAFAAAAQEKATACLFGCPAEETTGGKITLADAGLFDQLTAALIIHPADVNSVGGTSYATHPVKVTFHGQSAHIASNTHKGVNALDALVLFYSGLKQLKESLTEKTILGGIITHGGIAPNIVPDKAEAKFTVRALSYRYLEDTVLPAFRRLAEGIALATGTTVTVEHYEPLYKELINDKRLAALFRQNMALLGEEVTILDDAEAGGSTDVGTVSHIIPTLHPDISIGADLSAHTAEFATAACSPYAQERLLIGAKAMAMTALDLLPEETRI
ncbi:MAG: amidohydrolase [Sporomusaceae bacterium]|nr:amidohydrolase [Sporomusaceae bacterium]